MRQTLSEVKHNYGIIGNTVDVMYIASKYKCTYNE